MKFISIFIFMTAGVLFTSMASYAQKMDKGIKTEEFEVAGVCNMCKERIENGALIKGVKMAEWDKEKQLLKVVYKSNKVTLDDIHKAVAEVGHRTEKYEASASAYDNLPECCKYDDGIEKH